MKAYFNRNRSIMLVGGTTDQTRDLVAKLRDLGMDCVIAACAEQAYGLLQDMFETQNLPGLVVTDATLPDASGTEFVASLRAQERFETVPIIVATAKPQGLDEPGAANAYSHAKSKGLMESISGMLAMHGGLDKAHASPDRNFEHAQGNFDIVVAEDNDINQLVLAQFLETTSWSFMMVGNGRRAVHAFRTYRPKLILMDISMPDMNGREATAAIRALEHGTDNRIPIIALTAHALTGDREACLASGMDDYLAKPLNFADLRALIETYLGASAQARSAA